MNFIPEENKTDEQHGDGFPLGWWPEVPEAMSDNDTAKLHSAQEKEKEAGFGASED
jgi:hypothetical protein